MTDATDEFFAALAHRHHEPLSSQMTARVQFELTGGDQKRVDSD